MKFIQYYSTLFNRVLKGAAWRCGAGASAGAAEPPEPPRRALGGRASRVEGA